MGTTIVTPQEAQSGGLVPQGIPVLVQSELSALAHKHLTVSYALIGLLVLVMSLACVGGWLGLKAYESQVARAEAAEVRFEQSQKQFLDTLAQHDAQRTADAQAEAQLLAGIAKRDAAKPPAVIQEGLKPAATAENAAKALSSAFGSNSAFGEAQPAPDGRVLTTVPQTQFLIESKLDLDRTLGDLADEKKLNGLLSTDKASLSSDLTSCKANLVDANTVIKDYKKIAVKSKFRKFLSGAEKVAIFVAGAYLGHKL